MRQGMAILYCLGLSAIIVMIGFGFLRATSRDVSGGSAAAHMQLAQAAARAGVAEASEAIIADYTGASLEVGCNGAATKVLANPPTFLDGPYRAPFVSRLDPDKLKGVDNNSAAGMNDVRAESSLIHPMTRMLDHNSLGETRARYEWHTNGVMLYDGRGRYIEPNYRNPERPAPTGAAPVPAVPTLVLDAAATPTRHNALFLDSALRRIPSDGTPAGDNAARLRARYRLRYALGVIDLGGHLLSNPKADLNLDWRDPANEYRQPPLWLQEAAEAWYSMTAFFPTYYSRPNDNVTHALRWQNTFLGRGNASSFDRAAVGGFPVTFPMMFRINQLPMPVHWAGPPIQYKTSYWGLYGEKLGSYSLNKSETTGLLAMPGVAATAAGGQLLKVNYYWDTYLSHQLGPQPSWFTQHQSVRGSLGTGDDGAVAPRYDGGEYVREQAPLIETAMFLPTPFGRGMRTGPASGPRRWYEGRCDTPWLVNVLTAPPRAISCMLVAYLPPSFKSLRYCEENFALAASKNTLMLGTWNPITVRRRAVRGHDLFTRLAGPAFNEWPTPATPGVDPNFQAPDTRLPEQIYPGRMWQTEGLDDLGRLIDVDSRLNGRCSHTGIDLAPSFWGSYEGLKSWNGNASTPPAGWGGNASDWFFQRLGSEGTKSYWWDILQAASSAIGVLRAQWVQYPNTVFQPTNAAAFNPAALRDPEAYDSIAELDRLFLRQLGENYLTPGDGVPLAPIARGSSGSTQTYSVAATAISHTIRTLVTNKLIAAGGYTDEERGALMERVLNDFRMSFFGASPQHCDAFRPLDFDGDGKVMCSCYDSAHAPGSPESMQALDRYRPVDGSFSDPSLPGATGRGPRPDRWFSLAGTFYIGKSHHYRIICRGELFDNVVQRPVADATLESVLAVDPEGGAVGQSHYLFQRWHHNRYSGHLSLVEK